MMPWDTRARLWLYALGVPLALLLAVVMVIAWTRAGEHAPGSPGRADHGQTTTRPAVPASSQAAEVWQTLEDGLELGIFASPRPAEVGDGRIRILRINPGRFELRLVCASASPQGGPLTARQWCEAHGLVAAINAGMYKTDHRTATAFMRTGGHTNNPQRSKDNSLLVWDPVDANDAGATRPVRRGWSPAAQSEGPAARNGQDVRIADLEREDFDGLARRYRTLVQGIRMVTADGRNAWSEQPRRWSAAAIGTDRRGRVLFIHVRSPYRMHDLIDILLGLPIDLAAAQYAEGGPEAQLYVRSGATEFECIGSYETGFREDDTNDKAWPVPNVVGIARRSQP